MSATVCQKTGGERATYRHGNALSLWRAIRLELLVRHCHLHRSCVVGRGVRVAFRVPKIRHGREGSAILSSVARAVMNGRHHCPSTCLSFFSISCAPSVFRLKMIKVWYPWFRDTESGLRNRLSAVRPDQSLILVLGPKSVDAAARIDR